MPKSKGPNIPQPAPIPAFAPVLNPAGDEGGEEDWAVSGREPAVELVGAGVEDPGVVDTGLDVVDPDVGLGSAIEKLVGGNDTVDAAVNFNRSRVPHLSLIDVSQYS